MPENMELFIYRTPFGNIADFRPYLDGQDHSFEDSRRLDPSDPRWEKINNLRDPQTDALLGGRLEFAGTAQSSWYELQCFPIQWPDAFDPA